MANHSLGRPLDATELNVKRGLDLWYTQMDGAWATDAWIGESSLHRALTAKLLGLERLDAVVPKTSAAQGLRAVLNSFDASRKLKIVSTTGEFDSIDFVLRAYEHLGRAEVSWVAPSTLQSKVPLFEAEAIKDQIQPGTDLVVLSLVFFETGQILDDVAELIRAAHERDALVVLDVYHAAGVIPIDLTELHADFAIGGSYKYLRGGPGACWLAIHPRHLDSGRRTLDTGWFAKKGLFGYAKSTTPEWADGGDGWLESTPPVLTPYQAMPGLQFVLGAGVEAIRKDSLEKNAFLRQCLREHGIEAFEPANPEDFGAFSLLVTGTASETAVKLRCSGVNVDSRGNFVRFCPDCVTSKEEIELAAQRTAKALA